MGEFLDKLLYGYNYKKHKKPEATLCENMATITTPRRNDYGIITVVKSSNTDKDTSNRYRPPHAYLYDSDRKELVRFILSNEIEEGLERYTSSLPKSIDDIREMKGDNTTDEYKTRLFRYMTDKDEEGRFATNWERTVDMWNEENELWNFDFQG